MGCASYGLCQFQLHLEEKSCTFSVDQGNKYHTQAHTLSKINKRCIPHEVHFACCFEGLPTRRWDVGYSTRTFQAKSWTFLTYGVVQPREVHFACYFEGLPGSRWHVRYSTRTFQMVLNFSNVWRSENGTVRFTLLLLFFFFFPGIKGTLSRSHTH